MFWTEPRCFYWATSMVSVIWGFNQESLVLLGLILMMIHGINEATYLLPAEVTLRGGGSGSGVSVVRACRECAPLPGAGLADCLSSGVSWKVSNCREQCCMCNCFVKNSLSSSHPSCVLNCQTHTNKFLSLTSFM